MKARRPRAAARGGPSPAASPGRDTDASTFSPILADLVARVPGAFGAVLVDCDGEAVDYTGKVEPYDLKLAGAHWQILLQDFRRLAEARTQVIGAPRSIVVRGERRSFIAHSLPEAYALVLLLSRRAGFTVAPRAFAVCERAIAAEAGWRAASRSPAWFALQTVTNERGRPTRIRESSHSAPAHAVEIVGRIAALAPREKGWRVRLEGGAELTLICEPGGHWYADESPSSLVSSGPEGHAALPPSRTSRRNT